MRVRYENWVGGLTGDWLISRQRFFGVPIPVWYELDAQGNKGAVIVPQESDLPVDPASDVPAGYTEADRGTTFAGEIDIMDTWATSSLTPQIAGGWERDPELWNLVFPYSMRSQGQDIIRTWLFSTVLRAERARHCAMGERRDQRLHRRPRPQENVEVKGQRCNPGCDAGRARLGRGSLLGCVITARHGRRVRSAEPEADQDRAKTGDQGAQRRKVRVFIRCSRRR
jgi:hypothetical protein